MFPFQSKASSPPTRWTRLNTVQLEPFTVVPSSLLPLPPLRHPSTRASEPLAAGWSASSETQTPEASGLTRSLPFALNSSSFSSKSFPPWSGPSLLCEYSFVILGECQPRSQPPRLAPYYNASFQWAKPPRLSASLHCPSLSDLQTSRN